ncbi:MAG: S49 family peptidase, partial [Methylocystis sp.]
KDTPVREWKKKSSLERLGLVGAAASLARVAGLESIAGFLEKSILLERSGELDGLLAIWQHSAAN